MNNVKKIREQQGLSIVGLSELTGISERYLRFIEKGDKTPSLKTASIIASALKSTVDDVFLTKNCTLSTF